MSIITLSSSRGRKLFSASLCLLSTVTFAPLSPATAPTAVAREAGDDSFAEARRIMVERDLRARGIRDARLLAAMQSIPRHLFVPERARSEAYADRPLPIGNGQTISQPYIVAFMTEQLELGGSERVLEIGTGSGYQTAVLAKLAAEVFSVEIIPSLSSRARAILDQLGFTGVRLKIGDGFFGWEEEAPFDAVLVTAAASKVPEPLWRQVREGGRLIMPLGDDRNQRLVRVKKVSGKQLLEDLTAVLFVPLTGAARNSPR